MNKKGIVEKTNGNMVTVRIQRDSSCGENCAMCNACPSKNMLVNLYTDVPLSSGDTVRLETNAKYVLISAFCVYIVPIILLIAGYALANLYIGLICMALSFVILHFVDKKISTKHLIKVSKVH